MTKRIYVGLDCLTRGEFYSGHAARGIGTARALGVSMTILTRRTYSEAFRRLLDLETAIRLLIRKGELNGDPNELSALSETIVFEGGAGIKFADEGTNRRYSGAVKTAEQGWCLQLSQPIDKVNEAVALYAKNAGMTVTRMSEMVVRQIALKLRMQLDEAVSASNRTFTDPFEVTCASLKDITARARIRGTLREHGFHTFELGERLLVSSSASMESAYQRLEEIHTRATERAETLAIGASPEDAEFMATATHPVVVRLRGRRNVMFEMALERALVQHGRPPDAYTVAKHFGPSGFNDAVLEFLGR